MKPDLQALLAEWKPIIGVSDWRIGIEYVSDLPDGAIAVCSPLWDYLEAKIAIVDPDVQAHDVEETLVHELVHLPLAPLNTQPGTWERAMEERAVESIARGLISVKRGGRPVPDAMQDISRRSLRYVSASIRARRQGKRYRMAFDPVRFGEIMMELGGMPDLPDPAKVLIAELAGMATGSEAAPMKEEPKDNPMMPGTAMAKQADAYARKRRDIERDMARDAALTKARKDLGPLCKPALETRLAKMIEPSDIESTVAAVLEAAGEARNREQIKEPTDLNDGKVKPKGAYTQRLAARGMLGGA